VERVYQIFGLNITSSIELHAPAVHGAARSDLRLIDAAAEQLRPFTPTEKTLVYWRPVVPHGRSVALGGSDSESQATIEVHRSAEWYALRYPNFVDFFLGHESVLAFRQVSTSVEMLVDLFQGPVCAMLLELRGVCALHASAVLVGDMAIAFAGDSGSGKSTLIRKMNSRGHPLLTDDILPVRVLGERCLAAPGPPLIKLCENAEAGAWEVPVSDQEAISKKRILRAAQTPLRNDFEYPLHCIYILRRQSQNGPIELADLRPSDAVVALTKLFFCARLLSPLGLLPSRFELLGRLIQRVSVRYLSYPSGDSHLSKVCEQLSFFPMVGDGNFN
jgi:hypothetical protein